MQGSRHSPLSILPSAFVSMNLNITRPARPTPILHMSDRQMRGIKRARHHTKNTRLLHFPGCSPNAVPACSLGSRNPFPFLSLSSKTERAHSSPARFPLAVLVSRYCEPVSRREAALSRKSPFLIAYSRTVEVETSCYAPVHRVATRLPDLDSHPKVNAIKLIVPR